MFDVPHPRHASLVLRPSVYSAPSVSLLPFRVCFRTQVHYCSAVRVSGVTGVVQVRRTPLNRDAYTCWLLRSRSWAPERAVAVFRCKIVGTEGLRSSVDGGRGDGLAAVDGPAVPGGLFFFIVGSLRFLGTSGSAGSLSVVGRAGAVSADD